MIRVNLLAVERKSAKKKFTISVGQRITIACSLILVFAVIFIGWRYWAVTKASAKLDDQISAAQQETARLHSVILQVQQFEQRRAQLQQRVVLIEQLRKGQTGPVHMLDQISKSLPTMLWLTELKQDTKNPEEVLIDGRCTSQTGVSDFVANLESTGYFKKSIDIVSTLVEPLPQPPGELIKFQLRAVFQTPGAQPGTPGATGGTGTTAAPRAPATPAKSGG
jgi:type IV pilus assembly protein PilN